LPRLADYLNKPEYLFRPSQGIRRLGRALRPSARTAVVRLPWGHCLRVRTGETIGGAIWTTGVYDLAVSEVLWRLIEPAETVVDAGANIGYMTSLMARRAGRHGTAWAFEPHPEVFAELEASLRLWETSGGIAHVRLRQAGLSDRGGEAMLVEGAEFGANRGTAQLGGTGGRAWRVPLATLDGEFHPGALVGVLKVDVEGHEAAVLRGGQRMLAAHAIRDVVYEEHGSESAPATELLHAHGYEVFKIRKGFLGAILSPPAGRAEGTAWTPPSYLATTDPARALARLAPRGWRCLRGR
jgi:FkbM family methyltransferase